jgi:hypothetical protein
MMNIPIKVTSSGVKGARVKESGRRDDSLGRAAGRENQVIAKAL